jgi:diguanylate cyclase (GGDEF)-like protein/PAS domain S-box-containing protein
VIKKGVVNSAFYFIWLTILSLPLALYLIFPSLLTAIVASGFFAASAILSIVHYKASKSEFELSKSLKYQTLIDSLPDLIWVKDTDGKFEIVNQAFNRSFGIEKNEIIGKTDFDLSKREQAQEYAEDDRWVMNTRETFRREFLATTVHGEKEWVELIKVPVIQDDEVLGTAGTSRDISVRMQALTELDHQAHYDSLTQLRNRHSLTLDGERLISEQKEFALLFIDIDNFKLINDTKGHDIGDQVLVEFAKKLKSHTNSDFVYRLGGDEFIVMVYNLDFDHYLSSLLLALNYTFKFDNLAFEISASIGVSHYPNHSVELHKLMKYADIAMYEAKKAGKNQFKIYLKAHSQKALSLVVLDSDIRKGIVDKQFFVKYQPTIDSRTGAIVSAEALVRWMHPEKGEISPGEFIPYAEKSGLIGEIGALVITEVLADLHQRKQMGKTCLPISINVSAKQLLNEQFADNLQVQLEQYEIEGSLIELELTESILMRDAELLLSLLKQLTHLGVGLSLDDFGTGYSNLAYLSRFPLTKIKIDRSFITDFDQSEDKRILVKTIIELSQNLKMSVVAEGVETQNELDALAQLDCFMIQGFYYSKPIVWQDLTSTYLD